GHGRARRKLNGAILPEGRDWGFGIGDPERHRTSGNPLRSSAGSNEEIARPNPESPIRLPYHPRMTTLFISDLHLDAERPAITELFGAFMHREGRQAEAVYVLGDLFEAWVGDDDPSGTGAYVADRIREVVELGVPVYFIRGNRDFLVGDAFARRAGMRILPDPAVVTLYGRPTLLMHGDLLCTDDVAYQQFRAQTRDPRWQVQFLSQPLAARMAFAQQARAASTAHQSGLQAQGQMETITDASPSTVEATFARYGIDRIVHGH